ncbi:MAG: hypothetical protein KGS46_13625 [Chloroflexi bacterium]|nr:hypothetical protein [Chloroflexota bacterium]
MALNALNDLKNALAKVKDNAGVVDVYTEIAQQLNTQQGGLYKALVAQEGGHADAVAWCYDALPQFDTFYQTWLDAQQQQAQKRKENLQKALIFGGAMVGGFFTQLSKELKSVQNK